MSIGQPNLGNLAMNLSLQLILDCVKLTFKISHQPAAGCCTFQGIRTSLEVRKKDDILHAQAIRKADDIISYSCYILVLACH